MHGAAPAEVVGAAAARAASPACRVVGQRELERRDTPAAKRALVAQQRVAARRPWRAGRRAGRRTRCLISCGRRGSGTVQPARPAGRLERRAQLGQQRGHLGARSGRACAPSAASASEASASQPTASASAAAAPPRPGTPARGRHRARWPRPAPARREGSNRPSCGEGSSASRRSARLLHQRGHAVEHAAALAAAHLAAVRGELVALHAERRAAHRAARDQIHLRAPASSAQPSVAVARSACANHGA